MEKKENDIKQYRFLTDGEEIQDTDEFLIGTWEQVPPSAVGAHWCEYLYPCRRLFVKFPS